MSKSLRLDRALLPLFAVSSLFAFIACNSSSAKDIQAAPPPPSLPVITVSEKPVSTYQEFSASIEGSKDIEIRPQVEGYIEQIYVDEGAHVRKGQVLFRINDRPYYEQLQNARAGLASAKANLVSAEINVARIEPLVKNNIVSDVQLRTAKAAYDAAAAQVAQAQTLVSNAQINLGYTRIKAPVDGYIGRIPLKIGSLVGLSTPEPLTVLSEIKNVFAYFSLSESEFITFRESYAGESMEQKLKQAPAVELVLADGSIYPIKGKIELVAGQFNETTGSISFRASFPNPNGQLRSGNTGRIRIAQKLKSGIIVPQEATYEMQDKLFVFAVQDSNKVASVAIKPSSRTGNYYVVESGVKVGDRIVYSGLDRLRDGMVIQPQPMSIDSVLQNKPLP
jgi:membrane fusion protein, multidrug efflux system